ncbi:MAG: hypothetical protein Q8Q23_05095 [bacterium]|nr:hypothetical protein [bacterium]
MKKIILTLVLVFFIIPALSFVLVSAVNAQVGTPGDGSGNVPVNNICVNTNDCENGLSCVVNDTGVKVCCSTVWGCIGQQGVQDTIGLGSEDPRAVVANVVNVLLGFLGIIAVILILTGGFMWMTAAGNDDKISTSKSIMTAGVIGLVIVLASFGIATFVVNAFLGATGVT